LSNKLKAGYFIFPRLPDSNLCPGFTKRLKRGISMSKIKIQPEKKKKNMTLADVVQGFSAHVFVYAIEEDEKNRVKTYTGERTALYTDVELAKIAAKMTGRASYKEDAVRKQRKLLGIERCTPWGGARDGAGRPKKFILAGSLGGPHLVLFSSKWNILHNDGTPIGVSFDYDLAQDNALTDEYINDEIAKEKCVNYGAYYTNQTYDVAIQECGGGLSDNAKYRKRQNWDSTHSGGK
jgi:hypothetical protein